MLMSIISFDKFKVNRLPIKFQGKISGYFPQTKMLVITTDVNQVEFIPMNSDLLREITELDLRPGGFIVLQLYYGQWRVELEFFNLAMRSKKKNDKASN